TKKTRYSNSADRTTTVITAHSAVGRIDSVRFGVAHVNAAAASTIAIASRTTSRSGRAAALRSGPAGRSAAVADSVTPHNVAGPSARAPGLRPAGAGPTRTSPTRASPTRT